MAAIKQFAPWEEDARRSGISGRALEHYYFEMLKQKRGPLLHSTKAAFIVAMEEFNQTEDESKFRLNIGSDTMDGFRIYSIENSGSEKRQVWFTLSGSTEILASRRDSLQGDCGKVLYHASEWNDLVLVEKNSHEMSLSSIAGFYCKWMLGIRSLTTTEVNEYAAYDQARELCNDR